MHGAAPLAEPIGLGGRVASNSGCLLVRRYPQPVTRGERSFLVGLRYHRRCLPHPDGIPPLATPRESVPDTRDSSGHSTIMTSARVWPSRMFRTAPIRVSPEVMRLIPLDAVPAGCASGDRLHVALVSGGGNSSPAGSGVRPLRGQGRPGTDILPERLAYGVPPLDSTSTAAFFDLDRTLISRPTPIALASSFRRRRLLRKRDLLRATLWQLIFMLPGVDGTRRASVEGMSLLRGVPVASLRELLGEAMEDVIRPLLYAEPLELLEHHRVRGERTYLVSASLFEIVQHVADDLGFDGALGSTCEIVGGVFTGKSLRPCYGPHKAAAVRELAIRQRIDLAASTGYSDSSSDLAFLETVGNPVAINPDRRLRHIAKRRGWPILRFDTLLPSPTAVVETSATRR